MTTYSLFYSVVLSAGLLVGGRALAVPKTSAGPLVGHVSSKSAGIWMYAPTEAKAEITYWVEGQTDRSQEGAFQPASVPVSHGGGQSVRVVLEGLQPEKSYRYKVSVDGKSDPAWEGSFHTAPPEGQPGTFRVALTSCMKVGQPQASWYLLMAQQPDLHFTVGDTHYADTTDPSIQLEHHVRYRREPFHATVLRNIPTYSIWDDHDYGPNNSDGTVPGKEQSLEGWKQFWVNPGAGTAETPGAFFKFTRGDVEFFAVDGRYHRSPDKAPDDDEKRMLGDAQFAWLMAGLTTSKAKFKVILSGSTLDHSKSDGWKIYTFSRHRLLDGIREKKVSGVMYVSGDIHSSQVRVHQESDRVGYPFIEVISSGIANSGSLSFATMDFDTEREDPSVRVRIVHGDGTIRDDKTWALSELGGK